MERLQGELPKATRSKAQSRKKRKTKTTRSYRRTEAEVQRMLQDQYQASIGKALHAADELETRSLNFFHILNEEAQEQPVDYNNSVAAVESETDSLNGDATKASPPNSPGTFIQIKLAEPVVWPMLYRQKHIYDDSLLFTPRNKPHFQLQLNEIHLSRFQIRMLNRFQEQFRNINCKLSNSLISQLLQSPNYVIDAKLYRSVCLRQFQNVVFCPPTPLEQFNGLPTRRFLKLCFKYLRFTTHTKMLDEHRLAQQLEDLYQLYIENEQDQLTYKLRQELIVARQVFATQMQGRNQEQYLPHIKRQMRLIQQLRQRYYAEATQQRQLLHQLLMQWAQLKELRKQQQFQCTRFQLTLRIEEPTDLSAACHAWKTQFEGDLAEVYREELQQYYGQCRLWNMQQQRQLGTQLKPPRKPRFHKIMHKLRQEYERAFKDPEEAQVHVLRVPVDEAILSAPVGELQLHKHRSYCFKIYFDGQFVAQTRTYRLEPDLRIYMNECIGVLLDRKLPTQLQIWLYEKTLLTPHYRRLALITTPLVTTARQFEFVVSPKLAGDLYLHIECRPINGIQSELDDIQQLPDALRQTLLGETLKPSECYRGSHKRAKGTPLVFAEQQLQLCSIETLLENKRFQLLRSRHQQRNLQTKQLRFVPALEHELAEDYTLLPAAGKVLEPGGYWNPIDLHKHRGRKFLQLLYETIRSQSIQRGKSLQQPQPLLLMNRGLEQAGWTAMWRAVCALFVGQQLPREPAALRTEPWPADAAACQAQQLTVCLHVVRATGVPVRSRHILNVEERRHSSVSGEINSSLFVTQTLMYSNVRPFVSLSYGQRLCRSSTAEGSNPTWNEQLQLQLSGGQLSDLREDLKISLFDELIEQQYSEETYGRGADIYQRVQCNWLGEYRVPISCLLTNRKFEGCIELSMPKILVGYKRPLIDSVTNMAAEQYPEYKESVHLWYYLSIKPGYDLQPMQTSALACAELPELQEYLREQRLELQQLQPQRYIEPLVCTAVGKRVCLTRLLEPVPLPISGSDHMLDGACRFVSLISQLRSYDACHSLQGVWLDNQTVLDSTWASAKDLGVLLCNFMMTLGVQCWLVLGKACPHGECSFVLYRQPHNGELLLVAPSTGRRYQLQDAYCPLTRIYCIISRQNIYYNMQVEQRVSMTNFNLQDGACWLPLFNKRHTAPQGGVQKLDYVYKRNYDLSELHKQIERKVMKKISTWRHTRKTVWNRAFQSRLLRSLREMEKLSTYSSGPYNEPSYSDELEREYPSYRFYGFTLNFPYTNLAAISERIRTTCIHYNNNPHVEFCVAVHINGYANDVLSIWLFLLSIEPLH